ARHLLAGHGMRTDVIHPPLWALRDSDLTVPVLVHGPLMAMLVAPMLVAFGPAALDHLAWLGALAAALGALSTFRLGARAFGAAGGAAAAALFTIAPLTLRAVHHDPSLLVGAALLTFAIDRLAGERAEPLAAGIAIGLASLARVEMLACAVLLLPLAGRRGAPRLMAGAMACALPWWMHNARATGQPFFNLSSYLLIGYWGARPELTVLRDFSLAPSGFPGALSATLPALTAKWMDFLPHAIKRALLVPTGASGWLAIPGAALSAFAPEGGARNERSARGPARVSAARVRKLALASIAIACVPLAIMTITLYDSRYLTPFLPLWCLAAARGAEGMSRVLPPWGQRPRAWIGALALLALPTALPTMKDAAREARALDSRLASERAALRPSADGSRRLMFSDSPDFVAFTTRRPVVWVSEAEFRRLAALTGPVESTRSEALAAAGATPADLWFHDRDADAAEPRNSGR
ncbi:MAG: hypothetical protein HYR73_09950, partial [Candidatus Eisenbacteria bacterium]|nr:hypothetical protein [Candidatus Eisenbacteria bacterium]